MILSISPGAEKKFKSLSKIDQIIISKKIRSLPHTQKIQNEEKLKGYTNIYRVRVGSFRIVYRKTIDESYIILIGHRKDIYKSLKRILG